MRARRRRRGGKGRLFFAGLVGIATSSIGVAVLAGESAELILDSLSAGNASAGWPNRPADAEDTRLGTPPAVAEAGSFAFEATQVDSPDPVAYDPCQPIHVVVNARTAIPGHEEMLRETIAEVSRVTGLTFVVDGGTDRIPEQRAPRAALDGHGWEPVLVAWSDDREVRRLAGRVAGLGGSAYASRDGHRWLVTGTVIIDGADAARIVERPDGRAAVRAVMLHEFAHLLGLAHVSDRGELMYEGDSDMRGYGPGDLAGLAALGSGECVRW